MAQCRAGLVFDNPNIAPVRIGSGAPRRMLLPCSKAPEGAAESLAHHEVVGKRKRERALEGRHLLSGVHFHRLKCPQAMNL